jgi:hypothetical protein
MRKELDTGFTFFVMRANPRAQIPDAERAAAWHVGAITGEALHLALKLRAEALTRAAGRGSSNPATATVPDCESTVQASVQNTNSTNRLQATGTSAVAARRMEAYMNSQQIGPSGLSGKLGRYGVISSMQSQRRWGRLTKHS